MRYFLILGMFIFLLNPSISLAGDDGGDFAEDAPEEKTETESSKPLPFVDEEYFDFSSEDEALENADNADNSDNRDSKKSTPIKMDKNKQLTDTLKETSNNTERTPPNKKAKTWINNISVKNPLGMFDDTSKSPSENSELTLDKMLKNVRNKKSTRSNVSVFDISGVMLRMSLKQVDETMKSRGFKKIVQKFQIPNFIKWRNEEKCRNSGVVGYERLDSCVVESSKKNKQQYVQMSKYAKYETKEEIEVRFTSNYTENKSYKISYRSMAGSITGNSQKATYLRNIKIYDFWKVINQKYGTPDNKNSITWGLGGNKPYLKATTGTLVLEDPMYQELDYTRMSREDQRYMNTNLYSF